MEIPVKSLPRAVTEVSCLKSACGLKEINLWLM
jgi:hypothetical protein